MPRALWSGSLSFGLVNVPTVLVTAVRDLAVHFHQLHAKDAAPIEVQRWCSKEDVQVPWEEITHGYELDGSKQVIVSDEELEAIEPRRTRTIEIEQFVDLEEVDPIYFDHPYFLLPASEDDGSTRAYRLLTEVMDRTDRAALGRFVMRGKEYLAIVRVRDDLLTLTTMLFADEVRASGDVDAPTGKQHKLSRKQLDAAVAVMEELSSDWDPKKYKDRYRNRLRDVVARKRQGKTVKAPERREEAPTAPDLMAALERTLVEMKGDGNGRRSARPSRARRSRGGGGTGKRRRQEA